MNIEFTIRQLLPKDESKLREIVALSFSRLMGFFAVHSLLSEDGEVLIADVQGTPIGFVKLIRFEIGGGWYGCVLWIGVHPEFRRKGVASALTKEGTQRLKQEGAKAVFASTQRRNIAAQNLLIQIGFRRVGFVDLWRVFGGRVFEFYGDIWLAPGETVLIKEY